MWISVPINQIIHFTTPPIITQYVEYAKDLIQEHVATQTTHLILTTRGNPRLHTYEFKLSFCTS